MKKIFRNNKNLVLVVANKEVVFWEKALSETKMRITNFENALKFETATLEMINSKLEAAKCTDI